MYKLVLKLPFEITVASKQDYETKADALEILKQKELPSGFQVLHVDAVPEDAILLPFGKKSNV